MVRSVFRTTNTTDAAVVMSGCSSAQTLTRPSDGAAARMATGVAVSSDPVADELAFAVPGHAGVDVTVR